MTDSRIDTYKHIRTVGWYLNEIVRDLLDRAMCHDDSKLKSPESDIFDEFTEKLKDVTYGSPEYEEYRKAMKPALDHHYANNRHHPEHFPNGMDGMNLVDLLEMLSDWKAASLRHNDGNILQSIKHNQKRFGYGDELKQILLNTVEYLHY